MYVDPNRELTLGDDDYVPSWAMDGTFSRGLVPRDMRSYPVGSFAPPADIPLVDLTQLPGIIREMEAKKSRLSDVVLRAGIPSLDQNDPRYMSTRSPRWGYCWAHGPVDAVIAHRAANNQEYIPLSAFGLAYTIKNKRDEGAWGALAVERLLRDGVGPESLWPRFEQRMRDPGDPFWTAARRYKVTGGWWELDAPVYDKDLSKHQVLSCLVMRRPVPADFNWWGHHVNLYDVVDSFPNKDPKDLSRYGVRFRNSWGDRFGDRGFGVLTGSKSIPDNAVCVGEVGA